MGSKDGKMLLVGDNPFHNISHLSQERARVRGDAATYPQYAANLIIISLENGANGFMFSVSETTLSILRVLREKRQVERLSLYAIVPYAYEYVRLANQVGGITGIGKKFAKEIFFSRNIKAVGMGLKGVMGADPISLMRTYLTYEILRIKSSAGKQANLHSIMLHQLITDMALALDLEFLFKSYVDFMLEIGVAPGFNTGNFVYLVEKFREWNIDMGQIRISAPFNKVGFQMTPSREECEMALARLPQPIVIAISILAAGYLSPLDAVNYIADLPNIKGVSVGVSKEKQAQETFSLLKTKIKQENSTAEVA